MPWITRFMLMFLGTFLLSQNAFAADDDEEEDDSLIDAPWNNFAPKRPSLSFAYGFSDFSIDASGADFAPAASLGVELSSESEFDIKDHDFVKLYRYGGLAVVFTGTSLGSEAAANEVDAESWRFGSASRNGFSYVLGDDQRLTLYHSKTFAWSNVNIRSRPAELDAFTNAELDVFGSDIHFGTRTEAGIRGRLLPPLVLELRFERSIVFRRHIFFKWLGSELVEDLGQGIVDAFVRVVLKRNADMAPIVAFLLKNGLSYGIYELRSDKMNWPFDTEAPLLTDTFKIGIALDL